LIFLIIFIIGLVEPIRAQDINNTLKLTLNDVIDLAKLQSPSSKYYQNRNVNYYWRWKNFQANFRPQLGISGNLPDYRLSNEPITQPDGSIEFRQIAQLRTTADLALTQIIPQTGATIYGASSLYRVQDYNKTPLNGLDHRFILGLFNHYLHIIGGSGLEKQSPYSMRNLKSDILNQLNVYLLTLQADFLPIYEFKLIIIWLPVT